MSTDLRSRVDARIDAMLAQFYATVPSARHQLEASVVDRAYYARHNIENILRIRLARQADARAIVWLTRHDPPAAASWAHYTAEEMLHDALFARDLAAIGIERPQVDATEPFQATKLLQGYLYYTIEHEGPLALFTKAYFLEATSLKTQPPWLDNLERTLGKEPLLGARAHVSLDTHDDHAGDVWNAVMSQVRGPEDEARALRHLETVAELFGMYFTELHRWVAAETRAERRGDR
jgi:hypothetical protein